jgi:hypothetical protein
VRPDSAPLFQRVGKIVKLDVIRVLLRGIRPRVAHQSLQGDEVASAFAKETICESVAKLMRGEATNSGPLADPPDHAHQSLCASRLLGILCPADAVVLRYPLFDFDREDVVIELRLKRPKGMT